MASRAQNERKFRIWEELPDGGRRYSREFAGRAGGRARYVKEVDANERTVRFTQEIYDASGRLIEVHDKFPVDSGHKRL
jgi:YD repeat-containing protein